MRKSKDRTEGSSEPAEFYEREAPEYDRKRTPTGSADEVHSAADEIVLQLSPGWGGRRVLEIGVGTGRWTTLLLKQGARVVGLDISPSMVRIAAEKIRDSQMGGNAALLLADAAKLPFKASSFDGLLCLNVFSHLRDHQQCLREVARVLRPGGFLVVNYPNVLSYYLPYGVLVNLLKKSLRVGVFTRWYTLPGLKKDYQKAGLLIEAILGRTQLPSLGKWRLLAGLVRVLDRASRSSFLRYVAPTLFLRGVKLDKERRGSV